jgi:prepilin signal peptidase PulO-like enzyme (type II secretory pathway)
MSTSRPSIAELRAVTQAGIVERRSAEHWAGRLYMRRLSPYVTRVLVGTKVTPDALTLLMIVVGLVAAALVAVPTLVTAIVAAVAIQAYLLLDCVDGEVARWTRRTSAAGVYLDRLGHHVVEAAIVLALGFRAAGGVATEPSWWMVVGGVAALLVVLGKLESDLVTVARAGAGLPTQVETDPESRVGSVRSLRRALRFLPLHRLVGAVELSLLLGVAAVVDQVRGDLVATQILLVGTGAVALIVAVGHPLTILTSERLR